MKSRVVLGMLAMIGMLALSATVAHAGGRGIPVALTSFFVCHATPSGEVLQQKVGVESDKIQGGGAARTLITIGQAVMACAQAALFTPGTNTEIPPNPPTGAFELRCYSVSAQKKTAVAEVFDVEDALSGDETGVPVARDIRFVCGPAQALRPPE